MNLKELALEFYESNCIGCNHRNPVRLPNISGLHHQLSEKKKAKAKRQAEAREEAINKIRHRKEARAQLRKSQDSMREEIINLMDAVDEDASQEVVDKLALMAKQVPERFDVSLIEKLHELGKVGGLFRTEASLRTIAVLTPGDPRLVAAALHSLSRGDISQKAAEIVEHKLSASNCDYIIPAVPALCHLASRPHPPIGLPKAALRPGPLIKAYEVCPDAVVEGLEKFLRVPRQDARVAAAQAAEKLIMIDAKLGPRIAPAMLNSLSLPDDPYEDGFSSRYVTNALAAALLRKPSEIDLILQKFLKNANAPLSETIFETYETVPRIAERQQYRNFDALRLIVKRALEVLLVPSSKRLNEAVHIIDDTSSYFPEALEGKEDILLGAIALLESEANKPAASRIIDPGWNQMKQLEYSGHISSLLRAIDVAGAAIEILAARNPDKILKDLDRTFDGVRDREDVKRLRAVTIRGFAAVAMKPESLGKVLHFIYTAMADPAPIVRAAAAKAYGKILKTHGIGLPYLLHETFLLLLADPYGMVHMAALNSVRGNNLPHRLSGRLFSTLSVLCKAYSQDADNHWFLEDCLSELVKSAKEVGISSKIHDFILSYINKMGPRDCINTLRRIRLPGIETHPACLAIISRLLSAPEVFYNHGDDILNLLASLPKEKSLGLKNELANAAVLAYRTHHIIFSLELAEFLIALGEMQTTKNVFKDIGSELPNTKEHESSKREVRLHELAASLELASEAGDAEAVHKLVAEWKLALLKSKE